ncbi:kinase-like domain-containing protein [Lactarius deliciosus]|nr:kinase-like domain-containing protein [Lactarius deliciosus]
MSENARRDSIWLIRSRGAFGDAWNRYLVMDYYPSSLARIIFSRDYRPPRSAIRLWVEELALAMYELHNQRIVHCDLKPSNILTHRDRRFWNIVNPKLGVVRQRRQVFRTMCLLRLWRDVSVPSP